MRVHILDYSTGRRHVMGTLQLSGSQVQFVGVFPQQIKDMLYDLLSRAEDAETFLRDLPEQVSGSRLRAEAIE